MAAPPILTADTVTKLPSGAGGAVLVCGSHGGLYPGYLAAKAGLRAVAFNDAGVGRGGAGIASLAYLEAFGIAAAAVSHASCRIGDSADMLTRGVVSHANRLAEAAGVAAGVSCAEAADRLRTHPMAILRPDPPPVSEGRSEEPAPPGAVRRIVLIDSAAMVLPEDENQIVVTGSHGGLVGGQPSMALRVGAYAAVFNDAGIGRDGAGLTRLPALDARGIAAFTVSADSAEIGSARSSLTDGRISAVNARAEQLGARAGDTAREVIARWSLIERRAFLG
jgi:uncharacterized protein YunC (DUF1805 family)